MMLVVILSIVLDLVHDAWVEWRRFLWGDLAMRIWEKAAPRVTKGADNG